MSDTMEDKAEEIFEEHTGKPCITCGVYKELSEFGKKVRNKSGLNNKCKACVRAAYHNAPAHRKKYIKEKGQQYAKARWKEFLSHRELVKEIDEKREQLQQREARLFKDLAMLEIRKKEILDLKAENQMLKLLMVEFQQ
jgi:hypothetical protein